MDLFIPEGYEYVRVLTPGFYGPTLLIKKKENEMQFVLKCFTKKFIGNEDDVNEFLRIIKIVRHIKDKCFMPYHHIYDQETKIYCIRPFFEGLNLTSYVSNLDVDENLLLAQWKVILRLYRHLHKHKIYPTFIKPNNIFLDSGRIAFITDIYPPPKYFNPSIHRTSPLDVGFIAPECLNPEREKSAMLSDEEASKQDIWSLGVLLWYMTVKEIPWSMINVLIMLKDIQKGIPRGCEKVNPCLIQIMLSAMQPDPSKRAKLDSLIHSTPSAPDPSFVLPEPMPIDSSKTKVTNGKAELKMSATLRNAANNIVCSNSLRFSEIGAGVQLRRRQSLEKKHQLGTGEKKNVVPSPSQSLGLREKKLPLSMLEMRSKSKSSLKFRQSPFQKQ